MADGYDTDQRDQAGRDQVLDLARAHLEEVCRARDLTLEDISGPKVSRKAKPVQIEAVVSARRATPARYEDLAQLLGESPEALQRSVRNSLEIPHW